jgi:hypothetical protein
MNHANIEWMCIDGYYCADGDGIVVVVDDEHGAFQVLDQGDPIAEFDNLQDALAAAQMQLATEYPAIYRDVTK